MKYWTSSDRNTLLPSMTGLYLANRAIWGGVALASLAGAYFLFSFEHRAARQAKAEKDAPAPPTNMAPAQRSFGFAAQWTQGWARTRFEFAYVMGSPAYIIVLVIGVAFAALTLWIATTQLAGTETWPATRLMAQALRGAFGLFPIIIVTYYAGELVWRDR